MDDGDDIHHGEEHDSELEEFGRRKKRKKYKWASNNQKFFYIKLIISLSILEAYFIANYFISI